MNIKALIAEGSPVIIGFWTEGHQSITDFIECTEIEFDIEDKPIDPRDVIHGWSTQLTDVEILGDFDYVIGFSKKTSEDAQKSTYFFYE